MLEYLLTWEGEPRNFGEKIVEYRLQMHAHEGAGFDTWNILSSLTCERNLTKIFKSCTGIIFLKQFNGYAFNYKKNSISQYLYYSCGMTHVNFSSNKLGRILKMQQEFLKKEMKNEDVYAGT